MKYSVDMIRLKARVMDYDLYSLLQRLSFDDRVEYWMSNNYKAYHHNFRVVESDDFSFYVGIEHNTKRRNQKKDIVVEFNPSKSEMATDSILYYILFRYFRDDFVVVSVDVAIDLDIPVYELYFDRNFKRTYKYFLSDTGETHYIGEGDNRIKIYDKKKEQMAKGKKIENEWTRVEYSIRLDEKVENILKESFYKKISLIDIYKKSEEYDYSDKTLRAIIFAVNNGYDIKELSRVYREKVKKIIIKNRIDITEKDINKCIKDFFKQYKEDIIGYFELFYNPFIKN